MEDYRTFLADQILTEDRPVTYRYLSRSVKVHVNTAKQMLYEFHKSQNARKPGSIHATYLVYGVKRAEDSSQHVQQDGDVEMSSSMPEVESLSEQVPVSTLSLVQEAHLTTMLQQYEEVTSIHVYSIGPHPMNDLQMLADTARKVLELPPEPEKPLGAITNTHVQRRARKGGMPIPAAAKASVKPDVKAAFAAKPTASAPVKEEPKPLKPTSVDAAASSAPARKPVPSLKRGGSSGIMQAFAKGASAKPKKKDEPQSTTPSGADDSSMALSDDGEDDSEAIPKPSTSAEKEGGRKSRKEREAELRRMMEEDDDEEEEDEEKADTPMEEAEEPVEEPPPPTPEKEEPAEVVSSGGGDGRRRGRRRVTRKKQILDDQGYLVTIQEQGWESFSEDDTPAPSKPSQPSSASSSQAAKPKKAAAKGSQGSIMSFFSKK